jgi:uroporphyrinogen-III synthase
MTGLTNRRIVVTRADHQSGAICRLLRDHTAQVVRYPCIAIIPPADTRPFTAALETLSRFDWLILTSKNTVYALSEYDLPLDQVRVAAVGASTAKIFQRLFGRKVDFIPRNASGDHLAHEINLGPAARVLLPQSSAADATLAQDLRRTHQAEVIAITAYQTVIGSGGADVPALLRQGEIDALTFTSPSTVHNFLVRVGFAVDFTVPCACIGPTTAQAARSAGFQTVIMPPTYRLSTMIQSLSEYFDGSSRQDRVDPAPTSSASHSDAPADGA